MQSVTTHYLKDIILRAVNTTILKKRAMQHPSCYRFCTAASEVEMEDFIQSIPYFDVALKNFILGKGGDQTIISQAWETMFITKTKIWAESEDWLQVNPLLSIGMQEQGLPVNSHFLTLPY